MHIKYKCSSTRGNQFSSQLSECINQNGRIVIYSKGSITILLGKNRYK